MNIFNYNLCEIYISLLF